MHVSEQLYNALCEAERNSRKNGYGETIVLNIIGTIPLPPLHHIIAITIIIILIIIIITIIIDIANATPVHPTNKFIRYNSRLYRGERVGHLSQRNSSHLATLSRSIGGCLCSITI